MPLAEPLAEPLVGGTVGGRADQRAHFAAVPAADKARDAVLFDAEDGFKTAVRVEPLGACKVTLNGQVIEGARFKLTGKDVAAEWWFDKNGRAIRQEMKWDGRKVVMDQTGVK